MLLLELKIAQAEHAAFIATFNPRNVEGVTVYVPNIVDRMVAALKSIVTGRKTEPQRQARYIHGGVPAR